MQQGTVLSLARLDYTNSRIVMYIMADLIVYQSWRAPGHNIVVDIWL